MRKETSESGKKDFNPGDMIRQACREVIAKLDEQKVEVIVARDVAARVERRLDKERSAPAVIRFAAIEGIAQMARACLRDRHDVPGDDAPQTTIEAFAVELNERYAIKRQEFEDVGYVLRDEITPTEIDEQVIPMLTKRRDAYQRHIDLLSEWNRKRQS